MNKYLKLFETEDDFKSCLEAKIAGNNAEMGFPNVSVIGEEDSNGNFSASDVFYIKDLNKAEAVRQILSHWINPTTIEVTSNGANVKTLYIDINNGLGNNGYPEVLDLARFQPYDWYDKKTNTTYYAFISDDAYKNITESTGIKNVLDGKDVALDLLQGYNGYDPNKRFSSYNPNNPVPPYHGKIIYVTNLSNLYRNDIYERAFTVTMDNDTPTLTFGTIEPFDSDGYDSYGYYGTYNFHGGIEGYVNSGSGSGSGN